MTILSCLTIQGLSEYLLSRERRIKQSSVYSLRVPAALFTGWWCHDKPKQQIDQNSGEGGTYTGYNYIRQTYPPGFPSISLGNTATDTGDDSIA
jgi:hypothetical protein